MTEVPKIIYDRLRAAALEQALPTRNAAQRSHPDENLLSALAEQSLSPAERDKILEHLALCGDCRETVALALPAENVAALPIASESETAPVSISQAAKPAPHRLFAWPSLRWAALAAGVVVVGSVLLLRPGKLNQSNQPSASQQIASSAAPPSAVGPPTVMSPSAMSSAMSSANDHQTVSARRTLTSPLPPESAMLLARNKKTSQQADKMAKMPGLLAYDSVGGETGRPQTQTTKVTAASSESSPESLDSTLIARNDAPAIEKAKPAPQEATVSGSPEIGPNQQEEPSIAATPRLQTRATSSTAKLAVSANQTSAAGFARHDFAQHNFSWTISAGVLQRSLDGGQTWQDNLRAGRPLLCYASHSDEIWVGGQGGALYHSFDGGLTWVQSHPTADSHQLTADISHIDLRNPSTGSDDLGSKDTQAPTEIVVTTTNNESWTSPDSGKSWKAK